MLHSFRIVAATNFDEPSAHAVRLAARMASGMPLAELHFVTVVHEPSKGAGADLVRDADAMESAHERLRRAVATEDIAARAVGEVSVHYHVRLGKPAEAIEQLCADIDAQLLVVGSHGRGAVGRAVFGSVSQALVTSGRVPVLVARPVDYTGVERSPRIEPAPDADHPPSTPPSFRSSFETIIGRRDKYHVSGML